MKTTEDILAAIKREVKLSKKSGGYTPSGRELKLKKMAAQEAADKKRKDDIQYTFLAKCGLVMSVLGVLVSLITGGPVLVFFPTVAFLLCLGMLLYPKEA